MGVKAPKENRIHPGNSSSRVPPIVTFARIIRLSDWAPSKLPPLLTLSFLWILERNPSPSEAMLRIGGLLLFAVFGFSFGYLINDYSDRLGDRRGGKPNAMDWLGGKLTFVLTTAMMAAGGVAVLIWIHAGFGLLIVAPLSYAVAFCYSIGPRFKERGVLGLLASALVQRTIPALFALILLQDIRIEQLTLTFVYSIVGLRWILMHQSIDYKRDRLADVHTFISDRDPRQARELIRHVLFPIELLGLLVWFIMAVQHVGGLKVAAIIYACWVLLRRYALHDDAYSWMSYSNAYLGDLYSFFLPVSLAVMCVAFQPLYWPLLVLTAGLSYRRFTADAVTMYHSMVKLRE